MGTPLPEGLCADLLPEVIAKMRARHKGITIGIGIFGIPDIPAAIIDGAVHMGVAFEVPHRAELRQLARGKFTVGAIMRPNHPLANRRRLDLRICADYPLIVAKGNLAMRAQLEPMLTALQANDCVAVEAGSLEIMKQLVMRDQGIAFQTRVGLEKELLKGELVHVPLDDKTIVSQDLGIYVGANNPLPIAVAVFAQLVAEEISRREAREPKQKR